MKVGIIGCGAAGLSAIKQCLDENLECIAFEQGDKVGGTWNLYENVDEENILSVHSSMYLDLTTNLPKELMELDGLRYKEHKTSFIPQSEVIEYIENYAKHFGLTSYIKFHHRVEFVDPSPDNKWIIRARNLKNGELLTCIFDGVIICNGHYFDPFYPSIDGMGHFKHKSLHSHYFKKADRYDGKKVLVIGGGPSGIDIARIVSHVAKTVYFSFRKTEIFGRTPEDISIVKPGISHFKEGTVVFVDGTVEEIDEIIYCTGYNTTFPFLSTNCKIQVDENWVHPLYKHTISIEYPTMAVISVAATVCPFPLFALQIRFYLAYLQGRFKISKQAMYEDLEEDRKQREEKGLPKKLFHVIGHEQLEYCEELVKLAKIRGLPRVIGLMFKYHMDHNGKKGNYKVINDEEFVFTPI